MVDARAVDVREEHPTHGTEGAVLEAGQLRRRGRAARNGARDPDGRVHREAVDRDVGRVARLAVALPPHAELGAGIGRMKIAGLRLVGRRSSAAPPRHGCRQGTAHQEQHGDERQDDGERLAALVAVQATDRGDHDLAAPRSPHHGHCRGAARSTWDRLSPLASGHRQAHHDRVAAGPDPVGTARCSLTRSSRVSASRRR